MKFYRFPITGPAAVGAGTALTGADAHHIRRVLRLKPGDRIVLFDGSGTEYEARIERFEDGAVAASVLADRRPGRESPVSITVAQALVKEKKMDRTVRQLCEIGVRTVIPFAAARSVARPDAKKAASRAERWRKIAVEASKQCRRLQVPEILPAPDLNAALAAADGYDLKIVFWENAPASERWPSPVHPPQRIFLLVGPEGGFEDAEMARARGSGFVPASLGPRILRAETAAVVASAIAQHRWGDLGGGP